MISNDDKEKFLDTLREQPIVSVVCKRLGISKASVYRWRHDDADFKKKLEDALDVGRDIVNDLAESKLIAAIQRGDRWAIQYWLEFNNKRFYKPRKAMPAPVPQRVINKITVEVVGHKKPGNPPLVRLKRPPKPTS